MKFQDYFDREWKKMNFRQKMFYKWIHFWSSIDIYCQIFLYRVFKVDWHKHDEKEESL